MSRPMFICGGESGTASRRFSPTDDACANPLHDWPLPIGYTDADIEAHWRLRNGWRNPRCPDCRRFGWVAGKTTAAHVRCPAREDA